MVTSFALMILGAASMRPLNNSFRSLVVAAIETQQRPCHRVMFFMFPLVLSFTTLAAAAQTRRSTLPLSTRDSVSKSFSANTCRNRTQGELLTHAKIYSAFNLYPTAQHLERGFPH